MKHLTLATLLLFALSCSKPSQQNTVEVKPTFDSLLAHYQEGYLKLYPLQATSIGDKRYNNILHNTVTDSFRKEEKDFYDGYRAQLTAIDRAKLSAEDQISYDALLWECDINAEGYSFRDDLMPINQFWSMNIDIGQLAGGEGSQPFVTVKDYDNWIERMNAYVVWCDSALEKMKKGMKEGYVLPKALAKKVIPEFADLAKGPVEDHLFYSTIKSMPADFSVDAKARLTKSYVDIIGTRIIPAHKKLAEFFEKEYLPACRETSGIDAIPNGKAYYQYLVKQYTTTSLTPDEIFALGKKEVERIAKEIEDVKKQTGFKGDTKAFFKYLNTDKKFMPYSKPEEVIAHFNAIHETMKPNLAKLFNKTPKTGFEVRRTEAFREASASAEYNAGSQDGTRPGIFYVPIPDVKKYSIIRDEDLFLHEAIPGHHYQISLQLENTSLPAFRRILGYSSYAEGWGLYAESLGKELGLYTDPYQYFGMLNGEMHRAIRLVVDAGMHSQGWTREQAIQYSKDHEPLGEASIIAEIERYMAIPGQALSYKIGQLKIRELREKAEKELGDKFVVSQFHDQILDGGCLPLHVLEGKVNSWISSVTSVQ